MPLYPYQSSAVDQVITDIRLNPCLVAPTGSGKTTMGTECVRLLERPTLWLAHRRELILQAATRLRASRIHCGVIMAGEPFYPAILVQVASIQTLNNRTLPYAELVIIDEAHHTPGNTFRKILAEYTSANRIGLTATPFRLDGQGLGDLFGKLIVAAHADELVANGTLIEPKVYAPPAASMKGVKIIAGDYNKAGAARAIDKPRLIGDVVLTWLKFAKDKKTVLFAVNVEHSKHIISAMQLAGIKAEHIDGTTKTKDRDAALERLKSGETKVLSNCQVLTEGWDLPSLECAIVARPTASLCLHLQMIGRIMRSCEGKNAAIVLDHAGNFLRHGRVTRRLEYSLTTGVSSSVSPSHGLRTCPKCYRMVLSSRSECPECGTVFSSLREIPQHEDGELEEFHPMKISATPEDKEKFFRETYDEAVRNNYQPGWALYRFKERYGYWPTTVMIDGIYRLADPATADDSIKLAVLEKFVAEGQKRNYKSNYAACRFKDLFGHWPSFKKVV